MAVVRTASLLELSPERRLGLLVRSTTGQPLLVAAGIRELAYSPPARIRPPSITLRLAPIVSTTTAAGQAPPVSIPQPTEPLSHSSSAAAFSIQAVKPRRCTRCRGKVGISTSL